MQFFLSMALIFLAGGAFAWNIVNRVAWDKAWAASGNKNTLIPERRWAYDAQDLESFAALASSVQIGRQTALRFYVKNILKGSDILFAIALAAITAVACYKIAVSPMPFPWLNWIALPFGAMAILYGIADIAEDLKLAAILAHPEKIDRADAAATNMLTRIKIVSLALSVVGLLIFLILAALERLGEKFQSKEAAGT